MFRQAQKPCRSPCRRRLARRVSQRERRALRETKPTSLSHNEEATALASDLSRAWANEEQREHTRGITMTPRGWVVDA